MNYLSVQSTMGTNGTTRRCLILLETPCPACVRLNKQGAKINLVKNASFESDGPTTSPSNWQTWFQQGTAKGTIKTEAGTFGDYKTFWQDRAYEGISLSKYVSGISKGTYIECLM